MRRIAVMLSTLSLVCGAAFVASPAQGAPSSFAPSRSATVAAPSTPSPSVQATRRTVYLTFDDGPSGTWTPRYLDVLKKYNAKATFFSTGQHPDYHSPSDLPERIDYAKLQRASEYIRELIRRD